jgi:hypothetical protein
MDTSVSVTAELFTKAIECKELVESPPKMTRVIAGCILVPERRSVKSAILDCKLHREVALISIAKWHPVYEVLTVHHEGDASWLNEPRQENYPFLALEASSGFRLFCGHSVGKKRSKKKNVKG